jgi:ferredoxin
MAFLDRLQRDHADALHLYPKDEGARPDLARLVARRGNAQIYACGPERMLDALAELTADAPEALRVEHFATAQAGLDPSNEIAFDVELLDTDVTIHVPADQTMLQALRSMGVDVPSDCEEGLCGTCEVPVVAGEVDHRDKVLSRNERRAGERMMTCCSRSRSGRLKVRL